MERQYPSHWGYFDGYVRYHHSVPFGFKDDIANINRFSARFRVASSFSNLSLENFSAPTEAGYSGLCRVFLVWSAYEVFLDIIELHPSKTQELLNRYDSQSFILKIRELDVGDRFYKFIYERVNKTHKSELDKYFQEDDCNPQYLASAIRHIFAHGTLSANANDVSPNVVANICNILAEYLLKVMDDEFSRKIESHKKIEGVGY